RQLRQWPAALCGERGELFLHVPVPRAVPGLEARPDRTAAARGRRNTAAVGTAQERTGEREIRHHADAVLNAEPLQPLLDVAIKQIMKILRDGERRQVELVGDP